jgi:hypothetical protein
MVHSVQQIKFEIFVYIKEFCSQFDSMYKRLDFWFWFVFKKAPNRTAKLKTIGLYNAV